MTSTVFGFVPDGDPIAMIPAEAVFGVIVTSVSRVEQKD